MATIQDRLLAALVQRGSVEISRNLVGRITLTTPRFPGEFYFIGTAGSLRRGPTYTKSLPVTEKFKAILLQIAEAQQAPPSSGVPQ
jgi:hypothetical protein